MNCKSCGAEANDAYCQKCGQPTKVKRIDGHYIKHEIEHVLHFEKGMLYSIRELLINPADSVRNYITDNRFRLVKPIIFIIVTSLIYTLTSSFFHIEEFYIKFSTPETASQTGFYKIISWFRNHYGYLNLLSGAFVAMWLKLFFYKYGYNFFELIVLLCYVMGISMLINAIFVAAAGISHLKLVSLGELIGVVYVIIAVSHFFDKRKVLNYIKVSICYLLGTLTFVAVAFAVGLGIDFLTR